MVSLVWEKRTSAVEFVFKHLIFGETHKRVEFPDFESLLRINPNSFMKQSSFCIPLLPIFFKK